MANVIEIVIKARDDAAGVINSISSSLDGIGNSLIKTGGLLTLATAPIAGILASSVQAASEAQQVFTQLEAVLKSTGGAAGVTAEMADDLATSLSKVTRFEDEAILSAENLLLTFTQVGKDVFPDAIKAALDLSTAMGQDLQSSITMIGKALNDPIAGLTALTRVGIQFTDSQKTMIESMVAAGDVMGAQKIILEELTRQFGGSAEAAGRTFAGRLDIITNKIGNLKERIGAVLLPILEELVGTIDRVVDSVAAWAEANPQLLRMIVLIGGALVTLGPLLIGLGTAFKVAGAAVSGLGLALKVIPIALAALTSPIGIVVVAATALATVLGVDLLGGLKAIGQQIELFINDVGEQGLGGAINNLFTTFEDGSSRISTILEGFGMGREQAQEIADGINNVVQTVINGVEAIAAAFRGDTAGTLDALAGMGLTTEQALAAEEVLRTIATAVKRFVTDVQITISLIPFYFEYYAGMIWSRVQPLLQPLIDWFTGDGEDSLSGVIAGVPEWINQNIIAPLNGIWILVQPAIQDIADWWNETFLPAIQQVNGWLQENVITPIENLWTTIQPIVAEVAGFISNIATTLFQPIIDIINEALDAWERLRRAGGGAPQRILEGEIAPGVPDPSAPFRIPPSPIGNDKGRNPINPNTGLPFPPLTDPFGNVIGFGMGNLPFHMRDFGGRGRAGMPYLIGTGAQPELFIPDSSGTFYPRGEGMGGTTVNVAEGAINIYTDGGDPQEFEERVYSALVRLRNYRGE